MLLPVTHHFVWETQPVVSAFDVPLGGSVNGQNSLHLVHWFYLIIVHYVGGKGEPDTKKSKSFLLFIPDPRLHCKADNIHGFWCSFRQCVNLKQGHRSAKHNAVCTSVWSCRDCRLLSVRAQNWMPSQNVAIRFIIVISIKPIKHSSSIPFIAAFSSQEKPTDVALMIPEAMCFL